MTLTSFLIIYPIGVAPAIALWAEKNSYEYFSLNLSIYFDWEGEFSARNRKDDAYDIDEKLCWVEDVLVERVDGHLLVEFGNFVS